MLIPKKSNLESTPRIDIESISQIEVLFTALPTSFVPVHSEHPNPVEQTRVKEGEMTQQAIETQGSPTDRQAQGPYTYLALHTIGWKAFQDLCAQVCEEVLKKVISIYREAQDGGQDAVFLINSKEGTDKTRTGTVQCKFTSDPNRHLRVSDINREIGSIKELVQKGQAYSYYFLTNMAIDSPVAAEIRDKLMLLGITEPYICGREWITAEIRKSTRLRALVPRVYGLGDLSIILDERLAEQTKALLGHLLPSLGVYVPTAAHRTAVRTLGEHGIVLLLGPPASGKSMLASILATTALNADGHRCVKVDGPGDLMAHWNPHEPGCFYWVDDAFGPNQLRLDYVDHWLAIMSKVQAAVTGGNRFVLTSRSHIWKAAKGKLGTRNHPLFETGKAIVELTTLSPDERSQILYNHIKFGNQTPQWKKSIKPHIEKIAVESSFLPEIARRLGTQAYTSAIKTLPNDLIKFVQNPMEFLKTTISELNDSQKAALTLIFLHRSMLLADGPADESWKLIEDRFGVSQIQIGQALEELNGTFVAKKITGPTGYWTFYHPTITDSLSEFLRHRPDLVELYLKGAKVHEILAEVVCEGCQPIKDALIVPNSVNDLLVSRILEAPNEININRSLFSFLHERASDPVFKGVILQAPSILERPSSPIWKAYVDSKVCTFARAFAMGILCDEHRNEIIQSLENAIFHHFDTSAFEDDKILALFQPSHLVRLTAKLGGEYLDSLSGRVETIIDNADLDIDPEDNFSDLRSMVDFIREIFSGSQNVGDRLDELDTEIEDGTQTVKDMGRDSRVEWSGEDITPRKETAPSRSRSIFSDIDE